MLTVLAGLAEFERDLIRARTSELLWGVPSHDARILVIVALLMFGIATAASILPALRLLKLDPAQTLREE